MTPSYIFPDQACFWKLDSGHESLVVAVCAVPSSSYNYSQLAAATYEQCDVLTNAFRRHELPVPPPRNFLVAPYG